MTEEPRGWVLAAGRRPARRFAGHGPGVAPYIIALVVGLPRRFPVASLLLALAPGALVLAAYALVKLLRLGLVLLSLVVPEAL